MLYTHQYTLIFFYNLQNNSHQNWYQWYLARLKAQAVQTKTLGLKKKGPKIILVLIYLKKNYYKIIFENKF